MGGDRSSAPAWGTYFAQHVGPASVFELIESFLGPQLQARQGRHPDAEADAAASAGLEIVNLHTAKLRIEIHDVAAAVYLLRKVFWRVPGFTEDKYRYRLRDLHDLIGRNGPFIAHSTRHLIEARRPPALGVDSGLVGVKRLQTRG